MTEKKTKAEPPKTGLALLREPFPPNQISKLPKPTSKQTEEVKADWRKGIRCSQCGQWHHPEVVHLDYVGHAALTDRLLDCDPEWNWEPVAKTEDGTPKYDPLGGMWIRLTVCGLTRLGYGSAEGKKGGDAVKELIGDALRNAAMRFGAALDLWHKGDLHAHEDEDDTEEKPAAETETMDETPFDEDPWPKHEKDVERETKKIGTITSLDELRTYWSALQKLQHDVAADSRIVDAKDERKAAIMAKMKEAAQ